ncbi:hypothetical protein ACFE04_014077 [Oxalis oulophora]
MGADAASLEQEKTTVLDDLVPHGGDVIAFSIYESPPYAGLPPSPSSSTVGSTIYDGPYPGQSNNGMLMKPLGVDIPLGANPIICSPLLNRTLDNSVSMFQMQLAVTATATRRMKVLVVLLIGRAISFPEKLHRNHDQQPLTWWQQWTHRFTNKSLIDYNGDYL